MPRTTTQTTQATQTTTEYETFHVVVQRPIGWWKRLQGEVIDRWIFPKGYVNPTHRIRQHMTREGLTEPFDVVKVT